jgi:hypothetical protein
MGLSVVAADVVARGRPGIPDFVQEKHRMMMLCLEIHLARRKGRAEIAKCFLLVYHSSPPTPVVELAFPGRLFYYQERLAFIASMLGEDLTGFY